jgi:AcrR family transcriptional regulator
LNLMATATKTALLDAAKRLVAERGYAGTSVRDLAAAADANVASVSYHFGSRERLLNEAVLESFQDWTERLTTLARADPDADPRARVGVSLRALLDGIPEAQPLFAAFVEAILQARRSPELRSELASHYAEQRRRVGKIVTGDDDAEHTLAPRTVEILASIMIATADGLLLQSLIDPAAVPTGDELASVMGSR